MQSSDWNISTKHIGVGRVRWRVYSVTLSRSLSYQGCKPGPSAFKAHAFCFLPWPETSPSIFLNFSSALRTSFQDRSQIHFTKLGRNGFSGVTAPCKLYQMKVITCLVGETAWRNHNRKVGIRGKYNLGNQTGPGYNSSSITFYLCVFG